MDLKKTGRLIAKKRKALNLTLGSLSEQLGVTPQAVHLWETGQRYPDASSQVMLHKVLGLNPVEMLTGLEMFDENLKKNISSYMNRIDEKVFVVGNMQDEDGNDVYVDLSEYSVILKDENGDLSDRWIPYTDYYNVEEPKTKREEKPKTPYDPTRIYLNHGHCILVIPVEMLEKLGKPLYFHIARDRKTGVLFLVFKDVIGEDGFDIPEKVYNGKWKGIHVYGGEYGHSLCVEMGIRHTLDMLEIVPEIDTEHKVIAVLLDEAKRSNAAVVYSEFLLPQWQYDELWEDESDEMEEDEV